MLYNFFFGEFNMNRKKIIFILTILFLSLTFPLIFMRLSKIYSSNISTGLSLTLLLAIVVGLITPSLFLSWLIIISGLVSLGFLFLGYVVIPTPAKLLLLIAFPIEASLVNIISNFIVPWSILAGRTKDIRTFLTHYDFNLKLQTEYSAKKLYRKQISLIKKHPHLKLNTNLLMIHWENSEQFKELHPHEYHKLLNEMSTILKQTRLTDEFIYYLGNATFLVNSPNLDPHIFDKMKQETQNRIQQLPEPIPTHLKIVTLFVNNSNIDSYDTPEKILRYLRRELETTLIVEYLKEEIYE